MESYSAIGHSYADCLSDNRPGGIWHMLNQSVNEEELICPEPRRVIRAPFVAEGCNRLFSVTKGVLPTHARESLGILDVILRRDDPEVEHERPNHMDLFCGSPPARTSNPVIHDAMFQKEAAVEVPMENLLRRNLKLTRKEKASSPLRNSHGSCASRVDLEDSLGNFHGGKSLVMKMERASPTCGSSVRGNPQVRIEGFASGNSDSHCVVPALA